VADIGHNRLAALAAEVRALQAGIRRQSEQTARDVIEAGRQLIEAKALLPHGEWLAWLRDHVGLSPRTASRYMHIARSGFEIGHLADLALGVADPTPIAADIRRYGAAAWNEFVDVGRELLAIRDEIGSPELFANFVADTFGWHGPEAEQYIAIAHADATGDHSAKLPLSRSALIVRE
jgi:hypothetical protein